MKELLEYWAFVAVGMLAGLLPFRAAGRLGAFLGGAVYRLTPLRKSVTLDNLLHAFPEKSDAERRRIALGAFRNYGTALAEMVWAGRQSEETLLRAVRLPDRKPLDRHLYDPAGLVILSGHYGCWELIVQGLRLHLGRPLAVIVQRQRNRRIDALVDRIRTRLGNTTIPMGPASARESLRVLKGGGVLGVLADQSGPRESIYVNFFGRPAATHRGVAALALRNRSSIVMSFLIRQPDGIYDVQFEELPFDDLAEYSEENIRELTRRHTAVLERYIRLHPDHWLWMHKRWKHTGYSQAPEGAGGLP